MMGASYDYRNRPHVVLLGAGASRAAFPKGDANGLRLPLMSDFVETVSGLADYLRANGICHDGNIETLYKKLLGTSKARLTGSGSRTSSSITSHRSGCPTDRPFTTAWSSRFGLRT